MRRRNTRSHHHPLKKEESDFTMITAVSGLDNHTSTTAQSDDIWYFGYGPIVHPTVRKRRDICTIETRAAILPDHRLTFCYGGVVNIVPQRGYEVHGVLMKLSDEDAWERLRKFDSGTYVPQLLEVFPYPTQDEEEEQIFLGCEDQHASIRARVFVMTSFKDVDLDKPVERKPQERYLRLIQQGMRQQGVDEDYIEDFIMACPYIPSRTPEQWQSFPLLTAAASLPTISLQKYKKICNACTRKKSCHDIYFVLQGNVVHKLGPHEQANPLALWTRDAAHGNPDITLLIHKMIVDPSIPMVDTEEELTKTHYDWAENHMFEVLQQSGLTAQKLYRLADERQGNCSSATHHSTTSVHSSGSSAGRRSWRRPFVRSAIKANGGE